MSGSHYGREAGTSERQIHLPPPEALIEVSPVPTSPDRAAARFEVPTPDSRMRVKISILFVPWGDQTLPVTDLEATLYLSSNDFERAGYDGRRIPTTDVLLDVNGDVVHRSAPLVIPEDPDLQGFSQEFVTAGDTIVGELTSGQDGPGGVWLLQVRYQPDGQRLTDCDWTLSIRQCNPQRLGPLGVLPPAL